MKTENTQRSRHLIYLPATRRHLIREMMNETFTILSEGGSLVEVDGSGPYTDRQDGVMVPDGLSTIAPIDLATESVRQFRIDAGIETEVHVSVTDSPFGASIAVRRYVEDETNPALRAILNRWPWIQFIDEWDPTLWPGEWTDVEDDGASEVTARGRDIVVVTFATA
jgi:hypothetical protein